MSLILMYLANSALVLVLQRLIMIGQHLSPLSQPLHTLPQLSYYSVQTRTLLP